MKKKIIVLFLITLSLNLVLAQDLSDMGCEQIGNKWRCPKFNIVLDVNVSFPLGIACTSNTSCRLDCPDIVELCRDAPSFSECAKQFECDSCEGAVSLCFTTVELSKNFQTEICYDEISEVEVVRNGFCKNITFFQDTLYGAMVDPFAIDWKDCSMEFNQSSGRYTVFCPYNEKGELVFDGMTITGEAFFISNIYDKSIFEEGKIGALDIIMENLVYFVLIIVIILIFVWAVLPKKRKLRIKTKGERKRPRRGRRLK